MLATCEESTGVRVTEPASAVGAGLVVVVVVERPDVYKVEFVLF